ncbi:MAG: VaFE repeat-containing surface-anchored protein [Mogibacterium sp.]|nr:VaFE repeat-containing surface-anchored protein [Mogibacterium sp.]
MISLRRHAGFRMFLLPLMLALVFSAAAYRADAAAGTVTLRYGSDIVYGSGIAGHTSIKWVTHVDGEPVDLGDEAGVSRSYAYCVQPTADSPPPGTYDVTLVDDDDTGRISRMRKLIYYLPGSYGYGRVTKGRWFPGASTEDAYVIGHMALSWVYDNYSDSYSVWGGAPGSMVTKAKSIVNDLGNLADPPEDYEVFWVRVSGMQDVFGAFYKTEYGKVGVKKESAIPLITEGNANYSLNGAQYTLYTDAACTAPAKTSQGGNAVITVKADGTSDPVEVETGQYFMKETKAPAGYALDTDVHSIEVRKDSTTAYAASDKPKSNPAELLLQKADRETGQPKPQGGASLAEAEYTVSYYDAAPQGTGADELAACVSGREPAKIGEESAVWVFRTDEEGRVIMSDPDRYLVKEKSAELYRDSSGRPVFPIGIISVKETAAPEGYELDDATYYAAITDSGQSETLSTLMTFTGGSSLKEQVIRGDVKFIKAAEGRKRMGGVLFRFTSLTTGESHVLVTDRNGLASTASEWNRHSKNTNAGKTAEDGVWFNGYNSMSEGAKTDDSLGALPYDTYRMEELRCEANKGYELLSDEITIERPRVVVDLGTYDDEKTPEPVIETKARDDESGGKTAVADSKVIIVDEVSYSGVAAGRSYTIEGVLMDRESGAPLRDERGSEVKGSTEFYAESTAGSTEVRFEMDASSLGGRETVVFEYLKKDGELITAHADINNRKQTVKLAEPPAPEIGTKARDGESGGGKAAADKDVWIIDTVEYKNLTPGKTYILSGTLMDKQTERPLRNDAGDDVCAAAEFTPKEANGSVEVSFRFSGEKLAGKDAVAFEYLFLKETGAQVASHEDINSRSQTVRLTGTGPETGDDSERLLYCLTAIAAAIELVVLTLRRRNDRLNRDIF